MMSGAHRISTPHGSGAANCSAVGTDAKQQASREGVLGGLGPTVCAVIATLERQLLLTAASQPCQWNLWWHPCHGLHTLPSACPKGTT